MVRDPALEVQVDEPTPAIAVPIRAGAMGASQVMVFITDLDGAVWSEHVQQVRKAL